MNMPESPQATPSLEQTLATLQADPEHGLSGKEAQARIARDGPNAIPEKPRHPLRRFLGKFWNLSAWMIELIALLSFLIHKNLDMAIALVLLVVNAVLSFVQEQKANRAVDALRQRLQVMARVLRDGTWSTRPAQEVVVGDILRIRAGDFVPADLQVVDGLLQVDESALTGESHDVEKPQGALLYSGSVVRLGEATAVATATGARTWFGKTAQLVETAHPQLHVEHVISMVVRGLVVLVAVLLSLALAVAVYQHQPLLHLLPVALAVLMNAIPVALPVMFTVSMALGSLELTRQGVLITQLSAIEDAATLDLLCADKTGTLTANRLSVSELYPLASWSETDMLRTALWASNPANADPIDQAFLLAAQERSIALPAAQRLSFEPFSASTRRTEAVLAVNGQHVRCVKGALRTVGAAAGLDEAALASLESEADARAAHGWRALAVACAEGDGPLRLQGLAFLQDSPRPDSARLIAQLQQLGVQVKMLTGDALPAATEVARTLGLGNVVRAPALREAFSRSAGEGTALALSAGGFAEVFPEDKFLVVQRLQAAGHIVGMTGDGVNDAPALRQAEVGIAVSNATDVAKGAASAVLTAEGLTNIVSMIRVGRAIYQRILTWILYKVSQTLLKAGFVVLSFLFLGKFAISLLGIVMLVFMNDFMMISLATDRVRTSPRPETWNIGPQMRVAALMGALMLVEALGLLALGWARWGLSQEGGPLLTYGFEILAAFALFAVLSLRERTAFWNSRPSRVLLLALAGDSLLAVVIGLTGLAEMSPLPLWEIASLYGGAAFLTLGPNDWIKARLMKRALASGSSDVGHDA
ncbi:MAG: plasma-membrane proton-efflux P-type ATPase [Betaproteobacteria bacterium]|nr:plasma-membrane proton-efflux P-type ATPase [Betaproteobacteria bacterium]